jgi:hypothetical protein
MQENKITSWWGKAALIILIYIIWWLVFYGSFFLFSEGSISTSSELIKSILKIWLFGVVPIVSFILPYKFSKVTTVKSTSLYIMHIIYVIFSLVLFYGVVILLFLKVI